MIRTLGMMILLVAAVLLFGQIPMGESTLGARFQEMVVAVGNWGQEAARDGISEMGFDLGTPSASRKEASKTSTTPQKKRSVSLPLPPDKEEVITEADRESLMKILINEM